MERTVTALTLLLAMPLAAQGQNRLSPQISDPIWERTSQNWAHVGDRLTRLMPPGGRVDLTCEVTATGMMRLCVVAGEAPEGLGLGRESLRLTRYFKISPLTKSGEPVEGRKVGIWFRYGSPANGD